jgi:hypothetical protein
VLSKHQFAINTIVDYTGDRWSQAVWSCLPRSIADLSWTVGPIASLSYPHTFILAVTLGLYRYLCLNVLKKKLPVSYGANI